MGEKRSQTITEAMLARLTAADDGRVLTEGSGLSGKVVAAFTSATALTATREICRWAHGRAAICPRSVTCLRKPGCGLTAAAIRQGRNGPLHKKDAAGTGTD